MHIDRVHMAQQVSRFEVNCGERGCHKQQQKATKMSQESISAYKDDAGRCSEACPARVALRAACIRRGKVAHGTIGITLFYRTAAFFSAFRKQASFFPNVAARAEQKLSI